jgi:predicted lipoprotein with Yx(FWY)xxD motif
MRTPTTTLLTAIGAALLLAACGASADTPAERQPDDRSGVGLAGTSLGEILVDGDLRTLYLFTDDVDGESTCYDACAATWPPVPADQGFADHVDASLFGSVERVDGTDQLTIAGHPVYRFSGDASAGDVNGQGSGDVWFVLDENGAAVVDAPEQGQPVAAETTQPPAVSPTGEVLTDAEGFTLYVFTNDTPGVSNCNDPCSSTWPPVAADEQVAFDAGRLAGIERADGSPQLALDGLPLYTYAGDVGPGEVNGQEIGGVWFAVAADGRVIRPAGMRIGSTDIGDALIDPAGFTLYTFGNDTPGVSNCNDPCSSTWPPVPGETRIDGASVGLDQFSAITREDGSTQLTISGRPIYRYIGDEFPGDANGIAVGGGVWQGVAADAVVASTNPSAGVATAAVGGPAAPLAGAETELGPTLVDGAGMTLYGLLDDTSQTSTCNDGCASTWPPVPGDTPLPAGADPNLFHVIERADGSSQLAVGDWPLYRFSGDAEPGDINGQGSGGVWFAAHPDGWLYK